MKACLSLIAAFALACWFAGAEAQPATSTAHEACIPGAQFRYLPGRGRVWLRNPDIVILAEAGDPRIVMTRKAIAFWNEELSSIGSGFRFGNIRIAPLARADETYAANHSRAMIANRDYGPKNVPHHIRRYCGSVVIILANTNFVSFAAGSRTYGLAMVAIKGARFNPFHLPNVTQNVIAHELGHVLGLRHNADPTMLMCGRPADCRPDKFYSATPKIFPLANYERERLKAKYRRY